MNQDVFLVIALAVLIAMMFMNSRKRKKQAADLQSAVKVGVTVVLHSGIIGKIASVDGDKIVLESTPGTKLSVLKGAVRSIEASASSAVASKPAVAAAKPAAKKPVAKTAAKPATAKKPAAKKPAAK